jgi:hypothetical protein
MIVLVQDPLVPAFRGKPWFLPGVYWREKGDNGKVESPQGDFQVTSVS